MTVSAYVGKALTTRPMISRSSSTARKALGTPPRRAYRAAGGPVIAINAEPKGEHHDGCGRHTWEGCSRGWCPSADLGWRTTAMPTAAWRSTPPAG